MKIIWYLVCRLSKFVYRSYKCLCMSQPNEVQMLHTTYWSDRIIRYRLVIFDEYDSSQVMTLQYPYLDSRLLFKVALNQNHLHYIVKNTVIFSTKVISKCKICLHNSLLCHKLYIDLKDVLQFLCSITLSNILLVNSKDSTTVFQVIAYRSDDYVLSDERQGHQQLLATTPTHTILRGFPAL